MRLTQPELEAVRMCDIAVRANRVADDIAKDRSGCRNEEGWFWKHYAELLDQFCDDPAVLADHERQLRDDAGEDGAKVLQEGLEMVRRWRLWREDDKRRAAPWA